MARDLAHVHGGDDLAKATSLDECGNPVEGRGDTPDGHDVRTGSWPDRTGCSPIQDLPCNNRKSSSVGRARNGQHDGAELVSDPWAPS